MKRFKNILVAIGKPAEASAAVKAAVDLAKRNEAGIKFFSVVENQGAIRVGGGNGSYMLDELAAVQRKEDIESLLDSVGASEYAGNIEVVAGTPFMEVLRYVQSQNVDIVVKPAEGFDGPVQAMFFGSTSMHLIRKCPCPVWVIKEQPDSDLKRVVVALAASRSSADRVRPDLDKKLLQLASSVSARYGAEYHVVHAWRIPAELSLRAPRFGVSLEEFEEFKTGEAAEAEACVHRLIKEADVAQQPAGVHVVQGFPEVAIPEIARDVDGDLVVMGSVGTVGVPGFFLGTTAEQVLSQLRCSVLSVKPEGFISPIK